MLTTIIKPTGLTMGQEVRLWYMLVAALKGICVKLDADGGVDETDYEANCYTAIINTKIEDNLGNVTGLLSDERKFHSVSPRGITPAARLELLYNFTNAFETLCEQLDGDSTVSDADYEANCYTAKFLHMVRNTDGNTLGNGNTFWFTPAGTSEAKHLIDWFYNAIDAIETLCEQLDADGGVTDTNYEALWYTAVVLLQVENSAGNVLGN